MMNAFYFGCWLSHGHFLRDPTGRSYHENTLPDDFPIKYHILDGGLLPPKRKPEVEGVATLVHVNGWTIITFWDRSVDKRGACNSAFLFRGVHDFEQTVKLASETFPAVWSRFTFPIVLS